MFGSALAGRRVLLTGHTGFKGAWLGFWLQRLGAAVTGVALPPTSRPSLFDALRLGDLLDHRVTDLRDQAAVAALVRETQPEAVLHLAAQALVRRSYRDPVETFGTNVMGTVNLLDAVRLAGRPCAVVVVTSDKCYEERADGTPHAETDPLGGHDPYSTSKAAAELVVTAFRRSYFSPDHLPDHGVALASARAGNVIGGGDWAEDRIVPDIIRALAAGASVHLRHPDAVRPWQHVLDALAGYLALLMRLLTAPAPATCSAFNFGPAQEGATLTVRQLAERALARWGAGRWEPAPDPFAPREAPALRLSCAKAGTELGWRATWDAPRAVDATMDWYRRFAEGEDARLLCERDIESFAGARA